LTAESTTTEDFTSDDEGSWTIPQLEQSTQGSIPQEGGLLDKIVEINILDNGSSWTVLQLESDINEQNETTHIFTDNFSNDLQELDNHLGGELLGVGGGRKGMPESGSERMDVGGGVMVERRNVGGEENFRVTAADTRKNIVDKTAERKSALNILRPGEKGTSSSDIC